MEELISLLHKLAQAINTSTPSGRFFFHVMASLAEMERELVVEKGWFGGGAASWAEA